MKIIHMALVWHCLQIILIIQDIGKKENETDMEIFYIPMMIHILVIG